MGWFDRLRGRATDPLDIRRRGDSAAEHLRAGAPYTHSHDQPLPFGGYHGTATVALDRVYASIRDHSTVHVITPTEHYGRNMVNQVEQVAELVKRSDHRLAGLVLFWPRDDHQREEFLVPLFKISNTDITIGQGRLTVMTDHGTAIDHTRTSPLMTRYTDPDFGHCAPQELAKALQIPITELALMLPEIHQRAGATPGWWEACAAADERSDAAYEDFMSVLREWDAG